VVVVALWATLPVASLAASREGWHLTLDHWNVSLAAGRSLGDSLLLGLGAAVVATALTVAAGLAARARSVAAPAIAVLARVPIAIPGLVAGVAVAVAVGAPRRDLALIAVLVAAWELPLTLPIVAAVLARADRASEQAAVSLGAGRLATLGRVVMPALSPAAASIFVHGFTAGLTAVGTVIVLAERGRLALGVTSMLASASTGAVGAACAVATVLLALAGGATLLGRAVAGRESIPTLLA